MVERNRKKLLIGACAFIFVGIIAIAYAAFTQGLNINGSGVNRKSNFDIYFNNVSDFQTTGTASVVTPNPKLREHTTIIEDYEATLITPSDSIYFTFDIVNDGDYDATLKGLTLGPVKCSVNGNESDISAQNVCENIEYTMKYTDNNSNVTINDKLLSKETKSVKVTLTYKDTITSDKLPTNNVSISNLGVALVYETDSEAKTSSDGSTPYDKYDYHVGDTFTLSGDQYYVIADSERTSDYVTALKATPLTVNEVNIYGGVGTENNYVNRYYSSGGAGNINSYGGMVYYSSPTCGYPTVGGSKVTIGCESEGATNYVNSDIKYVVDAWAADKFQKDELKVVNHYKARLISLDDLTNNLGYSLGKVSPSAMGYVKSEFTPSWLYNSKYWYWTMSQYQDSTRVWYFHFDTLSHYGVNDGEGAVRPVINIYKSKLSD